MAEGNLEEENEEEKAEKKQKQAAAIGVKFSKQPIAQRGIAKKDHIDVNTSTGGGSTDVEKQSGARQLKRSGSKDASKKVV